jgi:hypothetical protein
MTGFAAAGARSRRWASGVLALLCAVAGLALNPLVAAAAPPPELFFYAPPYKLADGGVIASPVTVDPAQIAEDFPDVPEMTDTWRASWSCLLQKAAFSI